MLRGFNKKIVVFILAVILLMSLLVACSNNGTTSSKDSSDTSDSAKQQDVEEVGKNYSIKIYTMYNGTSTYILGVALADLINENSTWLHATALESPGVGENARLLATDPEAQKHAIAAAFMRDAVLGLPPFEEPYHDLRHVAAYGLSANFLMTRDPKLNTMESLDGKRVSLMNKPSLTGVECYLKYFEKIGVKVNEQCLGMVDGANALIDGTVDAYLGGPLAASPDFTKWTGNPALDELQAKLDLTYISSDPKIWAEIREEYGLPNNPGCIEIPAGTLKGQTNPIVTQCWLSQWLCHKDLPDEVVKEFLRIMKDNADKLKDFHITGGFITPKTMGYIEYKDYIHPAAQEFYEENGIEVVEEIEESK